MRAADLRRLSAELSSWSRAAPGGVRGRVGRALRWGGTLGLGGYLLGRVEWGTAGALLSTLDGRWLGGAVLLYLVDRALAAYKWRVLFLVHGYRLSYRAALTAYLEAGFLGAALPSTVGSDLIRAKLISRFGGSYVRALSSVVVERFLGAVALATCAAVGLVLFAPRELWTTAMPLVAGVSLLIGVSLVFLAVPRRSALRPRGSAVVEKLVGFGIALTELLRSYSAHPLALLTAFSVTLVQQYLLTVINWLVALSLGLPVPLTVLLWVWPLVMIAVRLPISLLGFGVRELVLLQSLAFAGITATAAVSLGLLSGLLDLLFVGIGGVLLIAAPSEPPPVTASAAAPKALAALQQ